MPPTDAKPHTTDWRCEANSCDSPCARSTTNASATTLATAMAAEATSMQVKPCQMPVYKFSKVSALIYLACEASMELTVENFRNVLPSTHVDMKNQAADPTSPARKMYGRRRYPMIGNASLMKP